jgi:predicted DNA-binding transcriptional regulator YafY
MTRKTRNVAGNILLRQWRMLHLIPRSPRVIGTSELVDRLSDAGYEVDIRTVQRDLNTLSDVMPLVSDQRKPQGWCWLATASQFNIPGLEPEAALAFQMAQAHLQSVLPASTLASLKPWFDSARVVLDERSNTLAAWPHKIRVLARGLPVTIPVILSEVQAAVYQAVLLDKKLSIVYERPGDKPDAGQLPVRVVSPLALVVRSGIVYLVCIHDGHADPRQLAMHRMRSAEMLTDAAARPDGFSIDGYIAEGEFGIPQSTHPIKLDAAFARHVAIHLRESPIADDQTITDLDDDTIRLRATVPDTLELRLWLRSFGDEVTVLKPIALRRAFRAMTETMLHQYTDS